MPDSNGRLPKKRALVEVDLPDEMVVYDAQKGETHALNGAAAIVWRALGTKTTIAALGSRLNRKSPVDGEAAVWLALRDFEKRGLLDEKLPAAIARVSRRKAMQQLMLAGAAIPAIQSVKPQGIAVAASALPCSDTTLVCAAPCPGNVCCVCAQTTEGSRLCVVPTCGPLFPTVPPQACTSSAGCPPGFVCVSPAFSVCCGQPGSFCVPICTAGTTGVGFCQGGLDTAQTQSRGARKQATPTSKWGGR